MTNADKEYEKQVQDWLNKAEVSMRINFNGVVKGFPFDKEDKLNHNFYTVVLNRKGKCVAFPFYDSYMNWKEKKRPRKYDVLSVIEKYPPEDDVWDFADEFGYKIHSRDDFIRVYNIHHQCKVQWLELNDMLDGDEELLKGLRNIA